MESLSHMYVLPYHILSHLLREEKQGVSVKFSSVIHLIVDNYYLRGFGFVSSFV